MHEGFQVPFDRQRLLRILELALYGAAGLAAMLTLVLSVLLAVHIHAAFILYTLPAGLIQVLLLLAVSQLLRSQLELERSMNHLIWIQQRSNERLAPDLTGEGELPAGGLADSIATSQ